MGVTALQNNRNLFEMFVERFPHDRSQPFITDEHGVVFSYAELDHFSAQLANYFSQLALKKGDRVAVQVKKSPRALMIYLACLRAGLIYLPLNTGYTSAELEYFLSDAKPALVICDPESQTLFETLFQTLALAASLKLTVETLDQNGQGSLITAAAPYSGEFICVDCGGQDLAAILYTSGTTGRPKGAMLSHHNLAANALTLAEIWGWTCDDVLLHALPIFHVHGLFVACHCVLAVGAQMIFLPGFDSKKIIERLPSSTVMMGVPTFYTRLLSDPHFSADICASMRLFISGSAPMLESTHHQFNQRTGQTILERYGMTETGMLVSNPLNAERRPGTVGVPLPEVEVRVVDADGVVVEACEVGGIQVKGPNVFQGYWQMPEKTAEEFTDDGFFITGDQGVVSEDGYISIVGRAKDMVITGGYNVYPKEIERVIDSIVGVKESAVFGVAHPDFGEAVVAAVVADGSVKLTDALIIDAAKKELATYKVPKRVEFLAELPRNTMGKVQKNLLRDMAVTH
jgi:malonyl-CoA/methylmalonyl-CoA synthetase